MKTFDTVAIKQPDKNVFNLSHDVKASYKFDYIYPFLCQPVYPGDTWNCRAEVFMRAMPLLAPVMHNVDLRMYFVFVPDRLIWNADKKHDFKIFITGGEDGLQEAVLPYFSYSQMSALSNRICDGSLLDHLGFPTLGPKGNTYALSSDANKVRISSLPLRAYQFVYNELFRNQNVQNEIEFSYDQGQETTTNLNRLTTLRKKCWEKDYFTSCLPFAQRGQAVRLPIEARLQAEDNTVVGQTVIDQVTQLSSNPSVSNIRSAGETTHSNLTTTSTVPSGPVVLKGETTINAAEISFTGLSIGTINDFRYCLRLQQWLENNARCGSRYIEQLLSHFGVVSSDARLQRPELLGGGVVPIIFSDVEQTSSTSTAPSSGSYDVLGNLGGKGTLYGKSDGFKKYFEEHGILLGLLTIVPRTSYQDGIPRHWTLMDKTDWYFPEFAHLGEQAVLNKEVFYRPLNNITLDPDGVFGYQGRFTELRYIPSSVHGDMRNLLQYWHFGRTFPLEPSLNSDFVEADTRANCFAVEDVQDGLEDPFVCQIHLDIKAVRPLPKYAVPTL